MSREERKRAAALAALERVQPGSVIGVGTGSTADCFIDALGREPGRVRAAVASSEATRARLLERGIEVVELNDVERLPLYVDGADEATRRLELIKGGGGALTREKIVASASDVFACIVDDSKLVERLGAFPVPVEVLPMALRQVARAIGGLGGRPVPRPDFLTDNGNRILDVHGLPFDDPTALETALNQIPGVVANGLFCLRPADLLIVGRAGGVDFYD
jgi:ribose 5-phosphate isomerase A